MTKVFRDVSDPRRDSLNDFDSNLQEQIDRAIAEYLLAIDSGNQLDREQWLKRNEAIRDELQRFLNNDESARKVLTGAGPGSSSTDPEMTTDFAPTSKLPGKSNRQQRREAPFPATVGGYQLLRLLGAGGMGQVYEGVDRNGHHVAIKVLSPEWTHSVEAMQRFRQEGEIASRIHHPRCVFVKAADDDRGTPFIVMELMSGRTLKDEVVDHGRMTIKKSLVAIDDVLAGMEEAHEHGMIHRDVKPANCYVETGGRIKLGDFGLSRSLLADGSITRTGGFLGTPLFASPEQVRGDKLDQRTDIYSAAATLYYLLVGQAPFADELPTRVIARIVSENPVPPSNLNPEISPALEQVMLKGLAREPENRFQTATEFREAIAPFIAGRQTIGRVGRRIAAYGVDLLLFGVLGGVIGVIAGHSSAAPIIPDFAIYLALVIPGFLYFLVCDALWGMTAGKAIFGQQVVDTRTRSKSSFWRILIRTIVFTLVGGVATDCLLIFSAVANEDAGKFYLFQLFGYLLSSLCAITVFVLSKGRYLPHDLASGTIVIDSRGALFHSPRLTKIENWEMSVGDGLKWPKQFGRYSAKGELQSPRPRVSIGTSAWLIAEDRTLQRSVLLFVRPNDSPAIPQARREINRTARLRWIDGGIQSGCRWDAFAFPSGVAPLEAWKSGSIGNWGIVGRTLRELNDELRHSLGEGEPAELWNSIDQVWINSSGRVCLVDSAFPDGKEYQSLAGLSSESAGRERILLFQTCKRLLEKSDSGRSVSEQAGSIEAILPVSARRVVEQLEDPSSFEPEKFRNQLELSLHSVPVVDRKVRTLSIAIGTVTLGLFLVLMLSFARIGHQIAIWRHLQKLVTLQALDWVAASEDRFQQLGNRIPEFATFNREDLKADKGEVSRLFRAYGQRLADAPPLLRNSMKVYGIGTGDPVRQVAELTFRVSDDGPYRIVVEGWEKYPSVPSVNADRLLGTFVSSPDGSKVPIIDYNFRDEFWSLLGIKLAIPVFLCLWGGVSGGGMMWWFAGLRLVDNKGRPARLGRKLLRSLLVWSVPICLLTLLLIMDVYFSDQQIAIRAMYRLLLYLPMVWAIIAVAFPRRTFPDWLLETHIVPK